MIGPQQSIAALKLSVAVFGRRAPYEVADLTDALAGVRPDALLVDVNCWGALSAAEADGHPVGVSLAIHAAAAVPGRAPFGLGLRPLPGAWAESETRSLGWL